MLAARVTFRGEEMPLRTAQAQLAVLPEYADREELGEIQAEASAAFNPDRLELLSAGEELEAELSGIAGAGRAQRGGEGHLAPRAVRRALATRATRWPTRTSRSATAGSSGCSAPSAPTVPSSYHMAYMRRLSPLESTYTKERATEVCLATLMELGFDLAANPNIKLDLDDRPQKAPRACVIASDPPSVVHLITRAQGGLHDYQAFLHEAGHALHYGGVDPSLPITFRRLSRDHALTEIYSYIVEAISREPEWHARYFGLSDEQAAENAEATTFLEALLFRRYEAKLRYELDFWTRFPEAAAPPRATRSTSPPRPASATARSALPVRHGRRLLLGRLPARLDPLGAAPPLPDRHDRRGLVAQPRDRRVPARPLLRGHEALERGDRRPHRLRPARHRAAAPRDRRLSR